MAGVALLVLYVIQIQYKRASTARQHGCGVVAKHRTKEPFAAFDLYMGMAMEVPSLIALHRRYGDTFLARAWLAQPFILTIAPENIRTVNTGKEWGVAPLRFAGMEYFCGQGFLTTDGHSSRNLIAPTFATNNSVNLSFLGSQVDRLLSQMPADGETVNLQPLFDQVFLNSSLLFLLGIDPTKNFSDAPSSPAQFLDAFQDALFLTMFRIMLGRAWKLVPQTRYLKACKTTHQYVDYYIGKALRDADTSCATDEDFLKIKPKLSMAHVLATQTSDQEYIRNQVLQGMMASVETISALLGNACFLLSRHPKYWQQIRDEVSGKDIADLDPDTLLNLKVTRNILNETLRLYPNFPLLARVALSNTQLPSGGGPHQDLPVFVPKGTQVVMSYFALHRNPAVFGDDVESFRPERWDSVKPGKWEFMGFGGGNRACLAERKALVEAAYVLVRLAQAYGGLETRDKREWKGELKLTCRNAHGCEVALFT
ncbi:cytochrome P450 alkane hydroxylase-like protein [Massariosphaeria phaeospora]|uniref:Cytochrome P450 alkane hydroxylase-like protein n=1 Tax=Massariosphaeria phaeospora TaxID=100035 RepID=A0A7C8IAF2_9PLEO|nr:cytochrome P450 alkane hydroxylase-like protein [Massariosphaeria phaeospora]